MEPETECVIDVEFQQIDCTNPESINHWYSASQVQRLLDLNKAALQKAIFKLTSIYSLDINILRRGGARATEYSQIAVDAIKLLNAQKFAELRKLVGEAPPAPGVATSAAIVFVEKHTIAAATAANVADENLAQIPQEISDLLSKYRSLGESVGEQAAAEIRRGFTEKVKSALHDLGQS